MSATVLLDTGPLVAAIDAADRDHGWAREVMGRQRPPFFTCEPVLTEAVYLLRHVQGGPRAVLGMVADRLLRCTFRLDDQAAAVARLVDRYSSIPMSLADACLVRMAELHVGATVLTLDGDFQIYRRNRTQRIPTIAPR